MIMMTIIHKMNCLGMHHKNPSFLWSLALSLRWGLCLWMPCPVSDSTLCHGSFTTWNVNYFLRKYHFPQQQPQRRQRGRRPSEDAQRDDHGEAERAALQRKSFHHKTVWCAVFGSRELRQLHLNSTHSCFLTHRHGRNYSRKCVTLWVQRPMMRSAIRKCYRTIMEDPLENHILTVRQRKPFTDLNLQ